MRCIATLSELKEKRALKFHYQQEGIPREGFIALFREHVVAYENVCRHVPITLDYGDSRFFNANETHFICQTHGATYEPLSGKCIAGPCTGASLKPLKVEVRDDAVWFQDPA
ncbi:MAG TPA: Rieske 2Fe-2S domain-containing protein [Verrucomicrobiae bacterium]